MKKFLILMGVLLALGIALYLYADRPIPQGVEGPKAELLADRMLKAVGAPEWKKLPVVAWTFNGSHHYVWDKEHNLARISWDDTVVIMNLNTQQGKAYVEGSEVPKEKTVQLLEQAYHYWCNDSFWFYAPFKVRDQGTTRAYVPLSDGKEGLLVTYTEGGVTPGDTYLWVLDSSGMPEYYRMWVDILPVGGLKATWQNWENVKGAKVAHSHHIGPIDVSITNIKVAQTAGELGMRDSTAGYAPALAK